MDGDVKVTPEGTQDVSSTAAAEGENAKDTGANAETNGAAAKTYDQAFIDKLLADQEAAREAAVKEALKVAGMDEGSKEAYEKEKAAKALEERESAIALRELKADAREVLAKNDIPAEFLDMLIGKDLKDTEQRVSTFKTAYNAAVQAQVEKRLIGKTPTGGNEATGSEADKIAAEIEKYMN